MKKALSILMAAVMLLTLLGGCSGSSAKDQAGNPPEEQPAAAEDPAAEEAPAAKEAPTDDGEEQTVSIWVEKSFTEEADKLINDRLAQFGEERGVKVEAEFIAATDYVTKLNAAVEAGNVPDITQSNSQKTVNYYPNLPYADVTDLVEDLNAERPMFKAVIDGTKFEGHNYYVPFYSAAFLLFLRQDIFEEAGVEIPTTWEELWDAAIAVSDPEDGIYGLGLGCGPTDEDCENGFRTMLWDCGGKLMDEDGNIVAGTDEGLRYMVEKYVELYEAQAIPPAATTWDSSGNNSAYLMGEAAMVINVPTLYNVLLTDENYADLLENTLVLNLPAGSESSVVFSNPYGWAIMKDAKNPDLARELVRYLYDAEWYDTYVDTLAPVWGPIYEDRIGSETWGSGINEQAINYVQNAEGFYGYPVQTLKGRAVAARNYYTFPIARMLNSIVTGNSTIDEAIAQLDKELHDAADTIG